MSKNKWLTNLLLGIAFFWLCAVSIAADLSRPAPFHIKINTIESEFNSNVTADPEFKATAVGLYGTFLVTDLAGGKLIAAVNYDYSLYRYEELVFGEEVKLHALSLPISYITSQGGWLHKVNVIPGLYSDLDEVSGEDYAVGVNYQGIYRTSPSTRWVMGAGVNRQFGDSQAFPILGVIYKPNDHFQYALVLPQIKINYTPRQGQTWFFKFGPNGNKWNVESQISEIQTDVDIVTKSVEMAFGSEQSISGNLSALFEVGVAGAREVELEGPLGETFDLDVEADVFITLQLNYRPQ
ncbi:MAG: hypothetical protein COB51_02465 [Moraxellaceae bacterium]|nr:MAG: hypothetical protein COB51_02465 [Moraxellaceae bacterium]